MKRQSLAWAVAPALLLVQGCAQQEDSLLQDRAQIEEQLARYAQLWDRKDSEGVVELLTDDAVFEWRLSGVEEQPPAVVGRQDILAYATQAHQVRLAGRQSRHHFSGLMFESLSETQAVTENILLVTHHLPGETPVVVASGRYRISWEKTDDGWRMAHRLLYVDR